MNYPGVMLLLLLAAPVAAQAPSSSAASRSEASTSTTSTPSLRGPSDPRPRVIVSTDIGGTDPDDFQSMVHFLAYADMFDIEGLISSPYGPGRREHILQVIDRYEIDYPNLKTYSDRYPTPDALRRISKQGAITSGFIGSTKPTEGSNWIVRAARSKDPRPLWILVWGGIDDLAQALHDAPDILPKLRVYFIGGPNKMWSVEAYNYIEQHHPKLWMIEANATYRGWFTGGNQSGEWGNSAFVESHIRGRGALGEYFATHLKGTIKMGDTPSVVYLLHDAATFDDPTRPNWGGTFVRLWEGRKTIFDRLTTEADTAEAFGVVEFRLFLPNRKHVAPDHESKMTIDGRIPADGVPMTIMHQHPDRTTAVRFLFSPRDAKVWPYVIRSNDKRLDGLSGTFTATPPPIERTKRPSSKHPNWWIDDPDPAVAEGIHPGAKSVNRWREAFLKDFAARMRRCQAPSSQSRSR
jgi:hypothetical protein